MRAFSIIMGILLFAVGVYCLMHLGATFVSLALVIGILMIAYGVMEIVDYFTKHRKYDNTGWVLAEGILTIILGGIVLFYPGISDLFISILFGVWLVVSGMFRIMGALSIKRLQPGSSWVFMFIMGILSIIVGIYGFVHPYVVGLAIAMLIGIFFMIQGINSIVYGIVAKK